MLEKLCMTFCFMVAIGEVTWTGGHGRTVNWTVDGVALYRDHSTPLTAQLGDSLTLQCGNNYSNLFVQTELVQYDSCNASAGMAMYDFNGICLPHGTIKLTLTENSQNLMNTVNFENNQVYYFTSYSSGSATGVNDPTINSGGQCAEGLKMIVVIGELPSEETPVTDASDTESTDCTPPTVEQNVTIRSVINNESGTYQIILSCNTSNNGTSPVFIANCTNNGMWTPDPNSFTCLDSGSESDGNSVRPRDNAAIIASLTSVAAVVIIICITIVVTVLIKKFSRRGCLKSSKPITENFNHQLSYSEDVYHRLWSTNTPQHNNLTTGRRAGPSLRTEGEESSRRNELYADLAISSKAKKSHTLQIDDDRVQYSTVNTTTVNHQRSEHENNKESADNFTPNLDSLLIQLRPEVTSMWFQLGEAIGIPVETLNEYSSYSDEECIVEVLDYWLRNQGEGKKLSWKGVSKVLEEIQLHQLAGDIMKVYTTGRLPKEVDMHNVPENFLTTETELPPPLPPKPTRNQLA